MAASLVHVELSDIQNVDSQADAISRASRLFCSAPKSTPVIVIDVDPDMGAFVTWI